MVRPAVCDVSVTTLNMCCKMSEIDMKIDIYMKINMKLDMKWYFVTKIVLTYCENKMFY